MALSEQTLLYRASLVMDHILTDARVTRLSTAIKLVRPIFKWPESEDEELRVYTANLLRTDHNQVHIRIMKSRHLERQAKRQARKRGDQDAKA